MRFVECANIAEAAKISEDSYDIACQRKGCPMPKSERVTQHIASWVEDVDDPQKINPVKQSNKIELVFEDEDIQDIPPAHVSKITQKPRLKATEILTGIPRGIA